VQSWGGGTPRSSDVALPRGAEQVLRADNPRLIELRTRYAKHPVGANTSLWSEDYIADQVTLHRFRDDSAYRWQTRGSAVTDADGAASFVPTREINYVVTAQYLRSKRSSRPPEPAQDDGLFGNCVVDVDGDPVSTDL